MTPYAHEESLQINAVSVWFQSCAVLFNSSMQLVQAEVNWICYRYGSCQSLTHIQGSSDYEYVLYCLAWMVLRFGCCPYIQKKITQNSYATHKQKFWISFCIVFNTVFLSFFIKNLLSFVNKTIILTHSVWTSITSQYLEIPQKFNKTKIN